MNQNFCPIHAVKRLLGGKWKIPLMFKIQGAAEEVDTVNSKSTS